MLKYSDNDLFIVDDDKDELSEILYIKNKSGIKIHPWLKKVSSGIRGYSAYKYKGKLATDCLGNAESFACGIQGYDEDEPIFVEKETGLPFGDSHKMNVKIAKTKKAAKNEYANPDEGDAIAITLTKEPILGKKGKSVIFDEEQYPFHVAYVLYKDENSIITAETFGALNEYGEPTNKVVFNIYQTNEPEESFYSFWYDYYERYNPVTIVLKASKVF